jgi:Ser/Thr protein kinase RdoA (MazF antagonist)
MIEEVLNLYGFNTNETNCKLYGDGLINDTWLVESLNKKYIIQRINNNIFKHPEYIDDNIQSIASFLAEYNPAYFFTKPQLAVTGNTMVITKDGYFRMYAFIENSVTYNVVQQPSLAYEAAKQFGWFTKNLAAFPVENLKITLPGFHDLSARYKQFEDALKHASASRLAQANNVILSLQQHNHIVSSYEKIMHNTSFKKRVMHHDTKISNVLFDHTNKGLCVIDLDTVMPGYFISDIGDMMRTYLPAFSEEETDLSKIYVREEYFEAIVRGYLEMMGDELTNAELNEFIYAGKFMIYMQALRFITDYLNNDVYYGAKYMLHNYNRSANQLALLESLMAKESLLQQKIHSCLQS